VTSIEEGSPISIHTNEEEAGSSNDQFDRYALEIYDGLKDYQGSKESSVASSPRDETPVGGSHEENIFVNNTIKSKSVVQIKPSIVPGLWKIGGDPPQ